MQQFKASNTIILLIICVLISSTAAAQRKDGKAIASYELCIKIEPTDFDQMCLGATSDNNKRRAFCFITNICDETVTVRHRFNGQTMDYNGIQESNPTGTEYSLKPQERVRITYCNALENSGNIVIDRVEGPNYENSSSETSSGTSTSGTNTSGTSGSSSGSRSGSSSSNNGSSGTNNSGSKPSFNNLNEFEAYKQQQQNKSNSGTSKSYIENEQKKEQFIKDHVRKNNERYKTSSTSSPSSDAGSSGNNSQSHYQQQQKAEIEAQAKRYREEMAARQQQMQRQIDESRATTQRWETANQKMSDAMDNYTRNIPRVQSNAPQDIYNATSVQSAYNTLESSLKQLKRQQDANLQNFKTMLSQLNIETKEDAQAGLVTALGGAAATAIKNAEIKAEMEKAQKAFEYKARQARDKLLKTYSSNYNAFKAKHAYEPDADMEKYYRDAALFWKCGYNHVKKRFSYNNTYWADMPSKCKMPSKPSSVKRSFTATEYLTVAQRKKKYYDQTNSKDYYEAAKHYLNKSLKKNPRLAEAHAFKTEFLSNSIQQYAQALYAYKMDRHSKYILQMKDAKEQLFNADLFKAIYAGDTDFLSAAVESGLYRGQERTRPGSTEKETPLTASINADQAAAYAMINKDYMNDGKDLRHTSFMLACETNADNIVEYLINKQGLSPDTKLKGLIALDVAFVNKADKVFASLIKSGAQFIPVLDQYESKPELRVAFVEMMCEAALANNDKLLLLTAINEEKPSSRKASALLFHTIINGQTILAETIIERLAPPEAKSSDGLSYVHAAIKLDRAYILDKLLDKGYSHNYKDPKNNTPEQYLLLYYPSEIMASSTWEQLDLNEVDQYGATLLQRAIFTKKSSYLVKTLLQTGKIDVNAKGPHGWTALHYATREHNTDVVNILLKYGADKKIKDNKGRRPYHIAKEKKNTHNTYGKTSSSYKSLKQALK